MATLRKSLCSATLKLNRNSWSRPETPQNVFTNTLVTGSDRLTIFVLDVLNSSFNEQGTARKELIEFLRKSLAFEEPICLITIDIDGVKVLHDFTTDPSVLSEALKDVTGHTSPKEAPQQDPNSFLRFSGHGQRADAPADLRIAAEENRLELLRLTTKAQELAASQRVHLTLDALHQIAEAFTGIPGRKSLIWATAGVPVQIDGVQRSPNGPETPVLLAACLLRSDRMRGSCEQPMKTLGALSTAETLPSIRSTSKT